MARKVAANLFAEQNLLAILISNPKLFVKIADQIDEKDFLDTNNRRLYKLISDLNHKNQDVSFDLLQHEILKFGESSDSLLELLNELSVTICDEDELETFINLLREHTSKRMLQDLGNYLTSSSSDGLSESSEIVNLVEEKLYEVSKRKNLSDFISIAQVAEEYQTATEIVKKRGSRIVGLDTGYSDLSYLISGFQPEQFIILAARPSVGKSAFALNLAFNIAKSFVGKKKTIAFFSLEMSTQQIMQRLVSLAGHLDAYKLQNASLLSNDDMKKFYFTINQLKNFNILFDDASSSSISDLRSKCRRLKEKDGSLELIIIDYLQLLNEDDKKSANRQETVSRISRSIKELARELKIPILALSQLSREVDKNKRENNEPELSNLRESGSLEQDADIVMLMHRLDKNVTSDGEKEDNESEATVRKNQSNLIQLRVAKNRQGRTGVCQFLFEGQYSLFSLRSKKEEADGANN